MYGSIVSGFSFGGMGSMKYKNTALVVEGGGLRGAYSGGILDVLADKEIKFGGACGTSAGATHLCSFLPDLRKRPRRTI